MSKKAVEISVLINDFCNVVGWNFIPMPEYILETQKLIDSCKDSILPMLLRDEACFLSINQKFELNKEGIRLFIDFAASQKVYFNYHEKKMIKNYFDSSNKIAFQCWIEEKFKDKEVQILYLRHFTPITNEDTIKQLHHIINNSKQAEDILHSLFAAYVFCSFNVENVHQYFSNSHKKNKGTYVANYYEYLHNCIGDKLKRGKALSFLVINNDLIKSCQSIEAFKDSLCSFIKTAYNSLSNHCYLSIYIDLEEDSKALKWELFSDIVLYAEKFIEEKLEIGYFHPNKIKEITKKYIDGINDNEANFEIANGGFTYKDCFILTQNDLRNSKHIEYHDNYSLLLLFEKNERDETIIPCPACRSYNVRGNSYPVIGVKSWECNNILCLDKSKFNRGKRYSLASLIKQEAIFDEANEIKNGTIRKWQLDVLQRVEKDDVLEFLIKHYTLVNDTIEIVHYLPKLNNVHKRNVVFIPFEKVNDNILEEFYNSSFFKRFVIRKNEFNVNEFSNISPFPKHQIFNGNSTEVLSTLAKETFDAAITSPPYYNAKEYSQWDNIYCYLYDMYNNACEVFNVLKPGATYLYNIFDYFDNENTIVFSAMGKKRMILGAYIIHLFKKAGFEIKSNVIWYKGHIQGNRSFNQGNTFPYYQAPLNCYEHIYQFVKPSNENISIELPDIANVKPIYKIVKGENILGHTAPFPKGLPNLLLQNMSKNEIILDPYAGSFTTARAAFNLDIQSISIELDKTYCSLGISLIKKEHISEKLQLY